MERESTWVVCGKNPELCGERFEHERYHIPGEDQ
ncbi:hypothetical protein SDC9_189995 [bioreactor metagenome]|uniref:Uncharacterized protein n=1 Tax=bioreactor metagenome TaxID=1076179 RepID=A0A645HTR8_9ZZZZ